MVRARHPFPSRFFQGVGHDQALFRFADAPQQEVKVAVEDYRARCLYVLKSFVTPHRADDKLRLVVAQHHIRTVVRYEFAEVVEQRFENSFEAQVLRESDVRIAQKFRFLLY